MGPALAAALAIAAAARAPEDITDLLARPFFTHGITSLERTPQGIEVRYTAADAFVVVKLNRRLPASRLVLKLRSLGRLDSAEAFYGHPGGAVAKDNHVDGVIDPLAQEVYLPLPADDYGDLRIDFDPDLPAAHFVIETARLTPPGWLDSAAVQHVLVWLFAIAIAIAWLAPGLLLFAICFPQAKPEVFELAGFALSIAFYFAQYLALGAFGAPARPAAWALTWLVSLALLAALASTERRRNRVAEALRAARPALIWFGVLVAASVFLLSFDQRIPLTHFLYRSVAGPKTFTTYESGDNLFQFVNARAIALGEPFSRYYHDGVMVYDVTVREILPGVLAAVMRELIAARSGVLSDSFFLYTLVGTVMNLMVVFPLTHLMRRYGFDRRWALLALALGANAFFVANLYYAWFKFAGAALILSGIAILLDRVEERWSWIAAALLFGIGANMHASNLLALPLLLAWLGWRHVRSSKPFWRGLAGPAALVAIIAALLTPWRMIQSRYLHPDATLIEQHYFDGIHDPAGPGASARRFFASMPASQQVAVRARHLAEALRLPEIGSWLASLPTTKFPYAALRWTWLELRYSAPLLYPLLIFFAIAVALRRESAPLIGERRILALLCAGTMALVVLAGYGVFPEDLTAIEPNAILLLLMLLIAGRIAEAPAALRVALFIFSGAQVARLLRLLFGHVHEP